MTKRILQFRLTAKAVMIGLLLGVVGKVNAYDFSAVCETGQTLFYTITDYQNHYVSVVSPSISYNNWGNHPKPAGNMVLPENITHGGINYRLTSIGYTAFWDCDDLLSVTIPNSVIEIKGDGTFGAFHGCSNLASITLGNSIESIGQNAFSGTRWHINQPDGVLYLGNWCIGHKGDLSGELVINENTIGIADMAFSSCVNLTSVIMPNSVNFIGLSSFGNCTGLTSIVIPNSVTSLSGFSGCTGLTTITIPDSVTSIGEYAFYGCTGLTLLNIGNSVTSIGYHAFHGCHSLTYVTIPKSITSFGEYAFGYCTHLTTVYFNAENAEFYASYNYVFLDCSNLTTIYIGPEVQTISSSMFSGCPKVHLVIALGSTPTALESGAFSGLAENAMLLVPCGKRMTYFSAWNMFDFNNIMEDCNTYSVSMNGVGSGGRISASSTNAQMGEVVELTVTPNAGMVLASLEVVNASDPSQTIPVMPVGKTASSFRFVMPPFGVSVLASFAVGTSVGENEMIDASVYPNPTGGQMRIEAEDLKHISINNMLGQQIYEGEANGDVFEYDFGKHDAGVYLVRIESTNGVAVKKVLVTR